MIVSTTLFRGKTFLLHRSAERRACHKNRFMLRSPVMTLRGTEISTRNVQAGLACISNFNRNLAVTILGSRDHRGTRRVTVQPYHQDQVVVLNRYAYHYVVWT